METPQPVYPTAQLSLPLGSFSEVLLHFNHCLSPVVDLKKSQITCRLNPLLQAFKNLKITTMPCPCPPFLVFFASLNHPALSLFSFRPFGFFLILLPVLLFSFGLSPGGLRGRERGRGRPRGGKKRAQPGLERLCMLTEGPGRA